jgi:hypothetical protein
MSETGATAEQIEAAAERRYNFLMTGYTNRTHMTGMGKTWDIDAKRKRLIAEMTVHARYLVPPGYQIVPAGSVVLTADEAATAREAVRVAEETAEGNVLRAIAVGRPDERDKAQRFEEAYRALAAKLGGGA